MDIQKTCELFNQYFTSVFTAENYSNIPEVISANPSNNYIENFYTDDSLVLNKQLKVKDGKASRDDGYPTKLLKELAFVISHPLTLIFQQSLCEGVVPACWKSANVTPIFKKGSRQSVNNYRPISLTSHIGQVFESIIRNALLDYIRKNDLLNDSHGFTSK